PHSVMVLRHGKVILEGYWKPYCADYPQALYSMSKSIVSTAVGMAVGEGRFRLSDKLTDFFPQRAASLTAKLYTPITVRHLLTMSAGSTFTEIGAFLDEDWVRAYLDAELFFQPGSRFHYNSLNSYMLSAIIRERTGEGLVDYLRPRLWEPLGITDAWWEKSPHGIEKGGWGLNLKTEDIAKLGQLYLQKGRWTVDGEECRLLSENWVRAATKPQIRAEEGDGSDGYGYQIWMCGTDGAYEFNGAFGQIMMVVPRYDVVVAVTAGAICCFLSGSPSDTIREFFFRDDFYAAGPLPPDRSGELGRLTERLRVLSLSPLDTRAQRKKTAEVPESAMRVNGRRFAVKNGVADILPLIQQVMHSNYASALTAVRLAFTGGACRFTAVVDGEENTLEAGLDGAPRYAAARIRGETYWIGGLGDWLHDDLGRDLLLLRFTFVETPDTRIIRVVFDGPRLFLRFDEAPGMMESVNMLSTLVGEKSPVTGGILGFIQKSSQTAEIERKVITPAVEANLVPHLP
ncbi:MAG TPA: serine hydrolase, partial [Oscillospiraceae bacterium]|nr:serine hydrolase [Oscillospiraceae bacterium]